jgi:hypothetical protein
MDSVAGRIQEEEALQFAHYRADLKRQFRRDCTGYVLGLILLGGMTFLSYLAFAGATIWTVLLVIEARATFNKRETCQSDRFRRWQRRQIWLAAGSGDKQSLKQLQNVQ